MDEYLARVESVDSPTTLCVSMTIGEATYPRRVKIRNLVPRDPQECWDWLDDNLVGAEIYCLVDRIDRLGNYVCDVDVDGFDLAALMAEEGIAD